MKNEQNEKSLMKLLFVMKVIFLVSQVRCSEIISSMLYLCKKLECCNHQYFIFNIVIIIEF